MIYSPKTNNNNNKKEKFKQIKRFIRALVSSFALFFYTVQSVNTNRLIDC